MSKLDPKTWKDCLRQAIEDVVEAKRDPHTCSKCGRSLIGKNERERGTCSQCEVASWSPEKRASIARLVGLGARKAFTDKPVSDAEIDGAIDEAFKHDQ
jgi:hypothetical protein